MKEELQYHLSEMEDALKEAKLARDDIDDLIETIHFKIDKLKEQLGEVN